MPTGRRATRKVETTYGRKQKERDWLAAREAVIAAAEACDACSGIAGLIEAMAHAAPEQHMQLAGQLRDAGNIVTFGTDSKEARPHD